jgi:hypothetical protein
MKQRQASNKQGENLIEAKVPLKYASFRFMCPSPTFIFNHLKITTITYSLELVKCRNGGYKKGEMVIEKVEEYTS